MVRSSFSLASLLAVSTFAACGDPGGIELPGFEEPPSEPPPPDHGSWLSMDVAPDSERVVISYYDRSNGDLGFAVGTPQDDGSIIWLHEKVDGGVDGTGFDTGDRGSYSSMRVAPDGTVWIAFYDATLKQLRYAHRQGGGPATMSKRSWVTGVIDGGPDVGTWASLDLDVDGKPVVAYHDAASGTLKVARPAGDPGDDGAVTWTTAVAWQGQAFNGTDAEGAAIFRPADVGEHSFLKIEGGTEFIATYDKAAQRLVLVEGVNGTYNGVAVSPEGSDMGAWPSVAIEGGVTYVAYHDVGGQHLMVSSRSPAGWVHEVADAAEWVGADTEIIRRNGVISVVYFDARNNDMKLASKQGAVWVQETLGEAGSPVGYHNEAVRVGEDWYAASYNFTTKSLFSVKLPGGAP